MFKSGRENPKSSRENRMPIENQLEEIALKDELQNKHSLNTKKGYISMFLKSYKNCRPVVREDTFFL